MLTEAGHRLFTSNCSTATHSSIASQCDIPSTPTLEATRVVCFRQLESSLLPGPLTPHFRGFDEGDHSSCLEKSYRSKLFSFEASNSLDAALPPRLSRMSVFHSDVDPLEEDDDRYPAGCVYPPCLQSIICMDLAESCGCVSGR